MSTKLDDLKAQYAELKIELASINTRILAIINKNNKSYTYSNPDTTHRAETHTLDELRNMRKAIREEMNSLEYQIYGVFVQLKNC